MMTVDGRKEHAGLMYYTPVSEVVLKLRPTWTRSWFVVGKDLSQNTLYVGQGFYHEALCQQVYNYRSLYTGYAEDQSVQPFRYRQPDSK